MRLRKILESSTKGGENIIFHRGKQNPYLVIKAGVQREPWYRDTPTTVINGEEIPHAGTLRIEIANNKAHVAGIFVYQEFRRQRVAEALYREGAKWMAEKGIRLYASPTQTAEAKAVWRHLDQKGLVGEDEYGTYVVDA